MKKILSLILLALFVFTPKLYSIKEPSRLEACKQLGQQTIRRSTVRNSMARRVRLLSFLNKGDLTSEEMAELDLLQRLAELGRIN